MVASLDQLITDALALPLKEREQLLERLLQSIEPDDDAPLSPEWEEEIKRRIQDIDNGMKGIPAEEVFAKLEAELRQRTA